MTLLKTAVEAPVLRVLIVDDEQKARRDIEEALASGSLAFEHCRSYSELMSRLEHEAVDAIILDLDLGDSCLQAPEAFAEIREKWGDVIIVVLSNTSLLPGDRKGTDGYLTKERFYADRMVLSDLLIEAMEKRAEQGILDADVVDQIGRDLPEKIVTLKGYVHDIRGDYVEVVVDQMGPDGKRQPKRLLMDAEMFEKEGLLLEDMAFVYRLYWQGGRMISEVAPDTNTRAEPVPEIEEMLKKVKEIQRKEAGRNRDGGQGA